MTAFAGAEPVEAELELSQLPTGLIEENEIRKSAAYIDPYTHCHVYRMP